MDDSGIARYSLAESRAHFLAEVRVRAPGAFQSVGFAPILDAVISWSAHQGPSLRFRAPGRQHTVSFAVAGSEVVLWAAYPRREDGAKIVVLPRTFPHLSDDARSKLMDVLGDVAPSVTIRGTGLLQVPLHLLSSDRALRAFERLLAEALGAVAPSGPG